MSALAGLGPLLDPGALWSITQQLWQARERLAIRTGSNIPSAGQLLVAFRMFINDQDRRRTQALEDAPEVSSVDQGRPFVSDDGVQALAEELAQFLMLCDASYADGRSQLLQMLDLVGGEDGLLEARWFASKFHPAYYIAYDAKSEAIVIVIRGSKEIADFITNLSCDTSPFEGGYGHSGIIQSAQNVAGVILPNLYKYLEIHRPRNGLVVVGHSLGGAVAALLAIMIRRGTIDDHVHHAQAPPRRVSSRRAAVNVGSSAAEAEASSTTTMNSVGSLTRRGTAGLGSSSDASGDIERSQERTDAAKDIASRVRCYAFSAPPCVSPDVAAEAKNLGVTTVVHGFDMVPRLSASSLDHLLLAISQYNWQGELQGGLEDNLRRFFTQAMGSAAAPAVAATLANIGPSLLGPIMRGIQGSATRALTNQSAPANRGQQGMHPMSKLLLGATAVISGVVIHQFLSDDSGQQQQAQPGRSAASSGQGQRDYPFAARFGLSADQVEEALIPNQPRLLHLPGRILHLERPFTPPEQQSQRATRDALPPVRIVEREPEMFLEVIATSWMMHDHAAPNMLIALSQLIPGHSTEELPTEENEPLEF